MNNIKLVLTTTQFDDAGLHPVMLENVKLCRYSVPTPIQSYCIPAVLTGHDVVAIAQTGKQLFIPALTLTDYLQGPERQPHFSSPSCPSSWGKLVSSRLLVQTRHATTLLPTVFAQSLSYLSSALLESWLARSSTRRVVFATAPCCVPVWSTVVRPLAISVSSWRWAATFSSPLRVASWTSCRT